MSEAKMGEIALKILMVKFTAEGLKVGPSLRRELGQTARDTGVPLADLEEFSKEVLVRLIGRAYNMQHVSLTMNDPIS